MKVHQTLAIHSGSTDPFFGNDIDAVSEFSDDWKCFRANSKAELSGKQ